MAVYTLDGACNAVGIWYRMADQLSSIDCCAYTIGPAVRSVGRACI